MARFKPDKPVSLEKVFVLYKRSNLASFLSFVGNRTVTKFSCVLLVNKVLFVFRELGSSRTFTKSNRNRLKAQIIATKLVSELQQRPGINCVPECLAWRYFQDEAASKSRSHSCSSFWSNDLTQKVQGFWFAEVSYTERASDVKENFPKFLARKDNALATILLSVEKTVHSIFTRRAITPVVQQLRVPAFRTANADTQMDSVFVFVHFPQLLYYYQPWAFLRAADCVLNILIIHSKYFPDFDWLKAHV